MQHEMTDMELSEKVCKALGIEPDGMWRNDQDPREVIATMYPNILDWAGFGRVVERLRERMLIWDHMACPDEWWCVVQQAGELLDDGKWVKADTLPRALALAVVAWEASR